jgi:hypothetical protein
VTYLFDADDELQDGPPSGPEPLRDLIIAQGMQETGIFVLLFTSDTATESGTTTGSGKGVADTSAAEVVRDKATELGIDVAGLTLFSDDAYLLQAALGETLVPDEAAATLLPERAGQATASEGA